MTVKQLTQTQLLSLERSYERALRNIRMELKLRRAAHSPNIKTYKTIKR
jgi:hypothetical protein